MGPEGAGVDGVSEVGASAEVEPDVDEVVSAGEGAGVVWSRLELVGRH